jgi:hypothetical protein
MMLVTPAMPAVLRCPSCPICRAWIAPRAVACPACHAERKKRHGMSLQAFQLYASAWLLCSAVVLLFAVRIAAAPWLPTGEPPEYALWLLHATDAKPPPACRITVRDLAGHEIATTASPDQCDPAGAASRPSASSASASTVAESRNLPLLRGLACALHSLLALAVGLAAIGLLRKGLRRALRRVSGVAWVVRARA